jgi:hypothetical protein
MQIKYRSPVAVILLSIVTFGIYAIVWVFKTTREINSLGATIPTPWLIFIPLVNIYFAYKYSEGFSIYAKKDNSPVLRFLLYAVISPVAMILVQIELNKFAAPGGNPVLQSSN